MTNKMKPNKSYKLNNILHNIPNEFWIFIAITAVVCLALLGIYHEFSKMNDGILFADDTAFQSVDYEVFMTETENYEDFTEDNYQYRYVIKAKNGLDQILYNELIQDKPEAHIRNLYMVKQLVLQSIKLLWFIFGVMILHKFVRLILKSNYKKYRFGINTLSFYVICFFIRNQIVIPSSWIPSKLIDISGWQSNINSYFDRGNGLEELSGYVIYQPELTFLFTILVIGVFLLLIINWRINKSITGQE